MKNLFIAIAVMACSSMALANHVISCQDTTGTIISAQLTTSVQSDGSALADVTISGSHYQGFNGNTSGVIHNVRAQFMSWGIQFDFQDANGAWPNLNFMYSVIAPTSELTQDIQNPVRGWISWAKVSQSDWQKVDANCQSYEE